MSQPLSAPQRLIRLGIIGTGLAVKKLHWPAMIRMADRFVVAAFANRTRATAEEFAALAGLPMDNYVSDYHALLRRDDIEAVLVCVPIPQLLSITQDCLAAGKHVLCEKPLGRNAREAEHMVLAAARHNRVLKVGFNHRHHPALQQAHNLAASGKIGSLMSIRAAYGHGGRPGYDQEWRGNPELAGGGELLDQGVHIVDLCRWFLGDFTQVTGMLGTWFWQVAPLEDNGFALLRTAAGQIATIHTSWTQWKNLFRLEIFGRDGYLVIQGLGGSYGMERLTLGIRRPESGPPVEETWDFPGPDISWAAEWQEFTAAIREGRQPLGNGHDGHQAARVIDAIYESGKTGRVVNLGGQP